MTAPALAVVIPHYGDLARLGTCLAALAPQLDAAAGRAEAVVADNGTPGGLGGLPAEFPAVRFVTEPEKGAAAARNRGVAETSAPHLAFLDCDCVPDPDWLETALALAEAPGTADLSGGRVDVFDETPPPRSGAEAFETVFAFHQRDYVERKGFSVTANLLTRRDVFEATGPMVVGEAEDVDWCHRATAKGYRLAYEDRLRVRHPTRSDWAALERKWRRTTAERFRSHGRGPKARLAWAAQALVVAASGVLHAPKVLASSRLAPGEKLAGMATLLRLRMLRALWMLGQALGG